MAQVIEQKDLRDFMRQCMLDAVGAAQDVKYENGLPVLGVEELTFDVIVVKNGTLNSIERKSLSKRSGKETSRTEMPEITETERTSRTESNKSTQAGLDEGKDTSTRASVDESTAEDVDTSTDEVRSTQDSTHLEDQEHGTTDTTTTTFSN